MDAFTALILSNKPQASLVHTLNRFPQGTVIKPSKNAAMTILKISHSANPEMLIAEYGFNRIEEYEKELGEPIEEKLEECSVGEWVNYWGEHMTTAELVDGELYSGTPVVLTREPAWEEIPAL